MNSPNTPWSIVLAGGEGERVSPLVQSWLGRHRPKQYCTFVGTRSMFQHTLHRAAKLTTPARMVTVVAHGHGAAITILASCASGPPAKLLERHDHAALAPWYEQEAAPLRQRAEEMRTMAREVRDYDAKGFYHINEALR